MVGICKLRANVLKIFIRTLLGFFFFLFAGMFFLQTPFVKEKIRKQLLISLSDQPFQIEIGRIEGSLPLFWKGRDVYIIYQGQELHFDTIQTKVAFFPLFKKQLTISNCRLIKGRYRGATFEGFASLNIDLKHKRPSELRHFSLEGDGIQVKMEGKFSSDFQIQEGHLSYRFADASIFSPQFSRGILHGSGAIGPELVDFSMHTKDLAIYKIPFYDTDIELKGIKKQDVWEGKVLSRGGPKQALVNGSVDFRFSPICDLITVENIQLLGPGFHLFGKMDLDPSLRSIEGSIIAQLSHPEVLQGLFPDKIINGRLGAKIDFQSFGNSQDLKCQIEAKDLQLDDIYCRELILESTIFDLLEDQKGEFYFETSHMQWKELALDQLQVNSVVESGICPFTFSLKGNYQKPFTLSGAGNWQDETSQFKLVVDELKGRALGQSITLQKPLDIDFSNAHCKLSNCSINIGKGQIHSRLDLSQKNSLIKIRGIDIPLESLPLSPQYSTLKGVGNFDVDLIGWDNNLEGSCNLSMQRGYLSLEEGKKPVATKGSCQIHLSGSKAQIHGEIKGEGKQFVHFSGTLPITYHHFPFKILPSFDSPFSGQLVTEAKIEDLSHFINIGHQRLEGWLCANVILSNTLETPLLQGQFELRNGAYENYFSGTSLHEISSRGFFNKQSLIISDLYATDGKGGSANGSGSLFLSPLKKFPFSISVNLQQFDAVSFDTLTGNFSGQVTISGDQTGALAKGQLCVDQATFRIPDSLPTLLPELPITFVNPPQSLKRKKPLPVPSSPLKLDIDLDVPKKAYVKGRGLSSELKGKMHITGNFFDVVANGKLELIQGEYIFSGKVFDLSSGEILFYDSPTPSSYISLTGNCGLADVDVTILLRGPLSSPSLSFQSSPQLPTSSLLSQILFNKDVSEITAIQSLQLAQTIISLSGNSGPDILEKIRTTLGIDRLTIITSENDPSKISLQIGKYLMRGVLLTLSSGAESRNVSVEVDLTKGIRFQAEMNEIQQGKFSLKWHHHY